MKRLLNHLRANVDSTRSRLEMTFAECTSSSHEEAEGDREHFIRLSPIARWRMKPVAAWSHESEWSRRCPCSSRIRLTSGLVMDIEIHNSESHAPKSNSACRAVLLNACLSACRDALSVGRCSRLGESAIAPLMGI